MYTFKGGVTRRDILVQVKGGSHRGNDSLKYKPCNTTPVMLLTFGYISGQ